VTSEYFAIQALSRTFYTKFQNFQAPNPFTRTFQGLEKWKKIQELSLCCLQFSNVCTIFYITGRLVTILKFTYFEGPFTLNSEAFKHQIHFQELFRALKNRKKFKNFQGRVTTLLLVAPLLAIMKGLH